MPQVRFQIIFLFGHACNAGDPACFLGQEDPLKKGQAKKKKKKGRDRLPTPVFSGFPGGSAGKESACNVGDPPVRFLGQEDPLEEGMATHSSILAWRIPMDRGVWQAKVNGVAKSRTRLSD